MLFFCYNDLLHQRREGVNLKAFPFLIFFLFVFSIFIILSSYLPAVALAKVGPHIALSSSHSVTVSATVDEHLTYFKDGNDLIISTNSHAQYLVLSPTGDLIGQVSGPTEPKTIHLQDKYFILIAQL